MVSQSANAIVDFVASFVRFFRYLFKWATIKKIIFYVSRRRLTGLAAEIAYSTMLGLFPAMIAFFTVIGMFEVSVASSLAQIAVRLQEILPPQVWNILSGFAAEISTDSNRGWFSLSFVFAIWVFSGAISATIAALDRISSIPRSQKRPFWQAKIVALILAVGSIALLVLASFLVLLGDFAIKLAIELNWVELLATVWKILSGPVILAIFATTLALIYQIRQFPIDPDRPLDKLKYIGFVVSVAFILLFLIDRFLDYINYLIDNHDLHSTVGSFLSNIWGIISLPVSLGIVATAFAFTYRFGPSRWISGTPLIPGAILAALCWAIVSNLFRMYVANFGNYNKVYGAVGAVIVLMLWLYISSLVMLLGYQLNIVVGEMIKKEGNREKPPLQDR
ncbi:MAG: YihY/virulence factor BrkB family protein [Prochloraceae cyanobacterium]